MTGRIPQFAGMEVMATGNVRDNKALHRFEIDADGLTAFVTYRVADGVLTFLHEEVPPARPKLIAGSLLHLSL